MYLTMFSIDLSKFSLGDFTAILKNTELIPSRRILQDGLDEFMGQVSRSGIRNVGELNSLLKRRDRYPELSGSFGVTEEYLNILRREIGSYESRPVVLSRLGILDSSELDRLRNSRIKNTKDLYERAASPEDRRQISAETGVDIVQIESALTYSDLLRIYGVGSVFARFFLSIGIRNVDGFLASSNDEVLKRYRESIGTSEYPGPDLRLEDLDFCRRFSQMLDRDIQWS